MMDFLKRHFRTTLCWAAAAILACLVFLPSVVQAQTVTAGQTGIVLHNANLRAGPGTQYAIIGSALAGTTVRVTATNDAGSWYHLSNNKWIAGFLVDLNSGGQAEDGVLPTVTPNAAAAAADAPTASSTPDPTKDAVPTPSPTPAPKSGNDFVSVERRLWDVVENGGSLDGPSVHCGNGRVLHVNVLDENGSRLNGVAVQVQYGAREIEVTGAQGKGDGVVEFVLGGGQDVKVIRNNDGAPVTSDVATGLSTDPEGIDTDSLLSAHFCQDEASCAHFAATGSCRGHFSWTVTFQRQK